VRKTVQYPIADQQLFQCKLTEWAVHNQPFCIFDNNHFTSQNRLITGLHENDRFDLFGGFGAVELLKMSSGEGAFTALRAKIKQSSDWWMGHLSYELKNELEALESNHPNLLEIPDLHFFIPRYLMQLNKGMLLVHYLEDHDNEQQVKDCITAILDYPISENNTVEIAVQARLSKAQYLSKVKALKRHIQRGDIYETNFCQEFYANHAVLQPSKVYQALNRQSPTPFSVFYGEEDRFVMCASPERYFRKVGQKVYTQPIKGTAPRGKNDNEDRKIKQQLAKDLKERTENVMIVDLVRNDFSRIAERNTVNVEELCGVYAFPQLHQMISTISATLSKEKDLIDVFCSSFPMGSMTGAPKIRAMELIEQYEESRRGIFSGSIGYITPSGDADFNVVIRSLIYNKTNRRLSFSVGGAITMRSEAEKEYEECMLKAKAMLEVLGVDRNLMENSIV
jgi:para-aminobenzoate synthetase component 1